MTKYRSITKGELLNAELPLEMWTETPYCHGKRLLVKAVGGEYCVEAYSTGGDFDTFITRDLAYVIKNYKIDQILSTIGEVKEINIGDHLGYEYFYIFCKYNGA